MRVEYANAKPPPMGSELLRASPARPATSSDRRMAASSLLERRSRAHADSSSESERYNTRTTRVTAHVQGCMNNRPTKRAKLTSKYAGRFVLRLWRTAAKKRKATA